MEIRRRTVIASSLAALAVAGLGVPAFGSEISLAKTKDLVAGKGRNFTTSNRKLLVYKASATSFSVFDAVCPHDGTILTSAMVRSGKVTCSNDKSVFNAVSGKKISGPSKTSLTKFKHRVVKGILLVTLPAVSASPIPSSSESPLISASKVPLNGGVRVSTNAGALIVVQPSPGEYRAFSAVCTHAGCEVSEFTKEALICVCHNSEFSPGTGKVLSGPARSALKEFNVTLRSGELFLAN